MSVTIRECLQLPSLSLGNVIAGHGGLDQIVTTVSVAEIHNNYDEFCAPNELLITAFYAIKDNVTAQCEAIEGYKRSGDVGLVLFYSDLVLREISPQLIEVANRLDFPIIAIPSDNVGVQYSDVISDIMEAVFIDRNNSNFFVNNTMERIAQLSEANRRLSTVMGFASEYAKASFFLCDEKDNMLSASYWPFTNKFDFRAIRSDDNNGGYNIYKMPFSDKNGTKLALYAASRNKKLNTGVMNEAVEAIRLFSVIWNYNLNTSAKEALITAILEDDSRLIQAVSAEQGIRIEAFNTIIFAGIEGGQYALKEQAAEGLKKIFSQNGSSFIVGMFGDLIVMAGICQPQSARHNLLMEALGQFFSQLEKDMDAFSIGKKEEGKMPPKACRTLKKVHYTVWNHISLSAGARGLYLKYCSSIPTARKIYPLKIFFNHSEIDFAAKCQEAIESLGGEKEEWIKLLKPIADDPEEDLLLTLGAYLLDAGQEAKKAAELLFVHRNTVQYRLTKIKNLIGLDFSQMPMQYEVYFAAALMRAAQP